jgi:hypothetical protein
MHADKALQVFIKGRFRIDARMDPELASGEISWRDLQLSGLDAVAPDIEAEHTPLE